MSWQQRGNRSYFYRVVRVGGRLVTTYCGSGPAAEAIARGLAEVRAAREAARESRRRIEANVERVGRLSGAVERAMAASGYYKHRGVWRKRGVRTMNCRERPEEIAKGLEKATERERARRHFEAIPREDLAAEVERLRVDVAGRALLELVSLATDDPLRAEATKRHVEAVAKEMAGPDASPLALLLARITATMATESDVASRSLYRVAGIQGGLATRTGAAADRWAKSAGRATVQAAKALALVQAVERRESERSSERRRYKVVG
jgi:hypothetical protein